MAEWPPQQARGGSPVTASRIFMQKNTWCSKKEGLVD
jgi:hypothetical protein